MSCCFSVSRRYSTFSQRDQGLGVVPWRVHVATGQQASGTDAMQEAAASSSTLVSPGQCLGSAHELRPGDGAYIWGARVRAAVVGTVSKREEPGQLSQVSVVYKKNTSVVPSIGDEVTCRVSRITSRMATVDILCVGQEVLAESSCPALIRKEDVRSFDVDKVEIFKSFRPGDIVLARVISLGDARAYLLTTVDASLGVVSATSPEGATMVPVSWEEFECPITKQREFRKAAKPPVVESAAAAS